MARVCFLFSMACLLALAGCDGGSGSDSHGTPDDARAMRWWNALNAEQMVAALYGDEATTEQTVAAQKMYADLDDDTKALVNVTADELYVMGDFDSIGEWWETLDCRLMRVAAGDGNVADPESPYCAHYRGSGAAKILSDEAKAHVDYVGMALLGRDDPGLFLPYVGMGTHGIGTTLEYVTVNEDGTTEPNASLEYTGYGMHRGRDVLMVTYSLSPWDWPCPTAYWDLATGNTMACLDEAEKVHTEWIPHNGAFAFPMAVETRDPWEYGWQRDGDEFCDDTCEGLAETWTVEECGIELEVEAGTFTVCRQSATANWDPDVDWIEWFDPENNLQVKTRYYGSVIELSDYDLVE